MKTNEQIFAEIREQGFITEQQMKLLKNRSNKEGHDVMDYDLMNEIDGDYGIPVTAEQGRKGLVWLYKQMKKRDKVTGYREDEIIKNAEPGDFRFRGFYQGPCTNYRFEPLYWLNGMEYVPTMPEIYICG